MIELFDNIIQMIIAAGVFSVAFFRAFLATGSEDDRSREWILAGLFAFEYFIGDLYNALYVFFYETTSQYFYISELCWYTAYLFMIFLMIHFLKEEPFKRESRLQLLIPVFTVAMGIVFYVRNGDLAGNIVSVLIMTLAIRLVINGLLRGRNKPFYTVCLVLIILEYSMWISSSLYWPGDTTGNPYFWFDTLFSISLIGLVPGVRKAVSE